jgi:RNase P subunit RPR2
MIEKATSADDALRKLGVTLKAKPFKKWGRTTCPFCPDGKQKRSNFAVFIDTDGVSYTCHRCGEHGKIWINDGTQDYGNTRRMAWEKGNSGSRTGDWRVQWQRVWR